ncbi:MAG: hypothetical protein ABIC96_03080 [Patescibacteria group bacterium]
MKSKCAICKKEKEDVSPKFIGNELVDPKPPFTKKQLVAKTLPMCKSCCNKYERGKITVVIKKNVSILQSK